MIEIRVMQATEEYGNAIASFLDKSNYDTPTCDGERVNEIEFVLRFPDRQTYHEFHEALERVLEMSRSGISTTQHPNDTIKDIHTSLPKTPLPEGEDVQTFKIKL